MPRHRRKRRNWIIVVLAALLLVGVVGGAYYVLQVARARTGPFKQALAARKAGDDETAEALVRGMLEADPTEVRARDLLIQLLSTSDRLDEAESLARYWLDQTETEALAYRSLSQIALRRNDAKTAVRYARMVADRDPVFSQNVLLRVLDSLDTPAGRERAARAAETLASLAKAPGTRASAHVYAAETLREVRRAVSPGPQRRNLTDRQAWNTERARAALRESRLWKERLPEAKALMARIDLLAQDKAKRAKAVHYLEEFLQSHEEAYDTRAALIRYLLDVDRTGAALSHVKSMRGAPPLPFLRSVSALAGTDQHSEAIPLIESAEGLPERLQDLVRARILTAGSESEKQKGVEAYEQLVFEHPDDRALVREGYEQIKRAGQPDRALRLLDRIGAEDRKARFAALLERAIAALRGGDVRAGEALISKLVAEATGVEFLVAFQQLGRIGPSGEAAAMIFLEEALQSGTEDPSGLRLARAASVVSRTGQQSPGTSWKDLARADLDAIARDEEASPRVLFRAVKLATVAEDLKLAGHLLGRAVLAEETTEAALGLYLTGYAVTDEAHRRRISEGLREAAGREQRFKEWLEGLADALAYGAGAVLRQPSSKWNPGRDVPHLSDALLQFKLAGKARDLAEAEAYARKIFATWPDLPGGAERVGAVLLNAANYEAVLALHQGDELTARQRAQRIEALRGLKRRDEALTEARFLVREMEGSDEALLVLGRLLREVDPDAAYAAISAISGGVGIDVFRAELLEGRGDWDAAAQVYESLLQRSEGRYLHAWRGLARARAAQSRFLEFESRVSAVLVTPPKGMRVDDIAEIVLLRGQCRESMGAFDRALDDYRRVLSIRPNDVAALNNAAWIINDKITWHADEDTKRREEALALVNRAIEAAPRSAHAYHTRAKVREALGRPEAALADLAFAIEKLEEQLQGVEETAANRMLLLRRRLLQAKYRLDRADLLLDLGGESRAEEARAIYTQVRENYPRTPEGRRAERALEQVAGS